MKTVLQILTTIFLVIYTYGIIMGIIFILSRESGGIEFADIYVLLLYLFLLTGYILSWKKELTSGIIYIVWYAASFVLTLFIAKESDGMELILGLPALLFGPMYILLGFRKSFESVPAVHSQWQYVLRYISAFYLVVYLLFAFSGNMGNKSVDLFQMPGLLLFIPMALFITGYIFTWMKENIAGILFVVWYALLILISAFSKVIRADGYIFLYVVIGLAILIQGVFYLNYWYRLRLIGDFD